MNAQQIAQAKTDADAILINCNHVEKASYIHSSITMPDGRTTHACCECWNAHAAARKAARKEELKLLRANDLKCCKCGKKPYTWRLAQYPVCGTCKRAITIEHNKACAKLGSMMIFASGQVLANTTDWYFTRFGSLKDWFEAEKAANPNLTV